MSVALHYAGILGSMAFFTTVMRGLIGGAAVHSTLSAAIIHLFLFAMVGYVVGSGADWIAVHAVRLRGAAAGRDRTRR